MNADRQMTAKLMFRLLPVQVLIAASGTVNGIITGLFASNSLGEQAMSAVGLYNPIQMFIGALSTLLVGGAAILCGQYMGRNMQQRTQEIFSLDILAAALTGIILTAVLTLAGLFTSCRFFARDVLLQPGFRRYLLGQVIGILPLILGNQFAVFLSLENKTARTTFASLVCIVCNTVLNYLFLYVMKLEVFGLGLASSLSMWVFLILEAQHFFSGKSSFRLRFVRPSGNDSAVLLKTGFPGAINYGYQALRGMLVNNLLLTYAGHAGVSAFAAVNSLLGLFWAIPGGMLAVSRMLMNISIGEEDRRTLADIMRTAMYRFVPLMFAVSLCLAFLAVPMTRLFFRDVQDPVYIDTLLGFRILPFCMPLSIICMHFACYGQSSGKHVLVHLLALLDGVVCVAGFSALLMPKTGISGVYYANILNGITTTLVILCCSVIKGKKYPRSMEELMVIPASFGVPEEDRMDLSLRTLEEVSSVSEQIQDFCSRKGLDEKRSLYAGLFLEEMAGNVIEHGFSKDRRTHTVDIRTVYKDNSVILRIKDDCIPFDPQERSRLTNPEDPAENIGIRMVWQMAEEIQYRNILGLNVLTIRI